MSVEAILGALQAAPTAGTSESARAATTATVVQGDFGEMVNRGISALNQQLLTSQTDLQRLATGDVQNLHQIMIRLEESRLSFQLLLQVRNRLLEAYQDVLKMQV